MLNKMSPFSAIIFSWIILKEKLTFWQGLAVTAAFAGSLFILKPTFSNMALLPSAVGLLGGISAGLAYTCVRIMGKRGVNGTYIVFFFSAFSTLVVLPYVIIVHAPMTVMQLVYLICAGLMAALGQFSITAAYCHAPAREISVYDYSQIIFSAVLGFIFFSQKPDAWSILGYIIICSMAVFMFIYNKRRDTLRA
jgi:drug/metabolite transporter (DMT)-like permease